MDRSSGNNADLPIACTLTPSELSHRKEQVLRGLLSKAVDMHPLPGGFRWRFDPEAGIVPQAAAVIEVERRCCRFLHFRLEVEASEGPVWLEVTGPAGTAEFLASLLEETGPIRPRS